MIIAFLISSTIQKLELPKFLDIINDFNCP